MLAKLLRTTAGALLDGSQPGSVSWQRRWGEYYSAIPARVRIVLLSFPGQQ